MARKVTYVEWDGGRAIHSATIEAFAADGVGEVTDAQLEELYASAEAQARALGHEVTRLAEDSVRPTDLDALMLRADGIIGVKPGHAGGAIVGSEQRAIAGVKYPVR